MAREFSAGAVVVRRLEGRWWLAAIRPGGKPEGVWALPKGQIAPGDSADDTALREVAEETGLQGRLDGKLGDVRYVYTWKGERIFKVVSFFLVRYDAAGSATSRRSSRTRSRRRAGCRCRTPSTCWRTRASVRWPKRRFRRL